MSYWLISVPNQGRTEKALLGELDSAVKSLAKTNQFRVPALKVGTLDTLMSLSDDLAKYDNSVGQIAKKIEKTYFDLSKAEEDAKPAEGKDGAAAPKKKEETKQQEVEQLKIGNATPRDFLEKFTWNETRYPKRSPLRTLTELIVKEASKSDDALKKQLTEYNEVRSTYAAIERKDTGSLLVKGLGGIVKEKDLIEKGHLTTLLLVVPRTRAQEFEDIYELMEEQQRERDEQEKKRKELEAKQRADAEKERADRLKLEEEKPHNVPDEAEDVADQEESEVERTQAAKEAAEKEAVHAAKVAREERENAKNRRLPCPIVVPRSAKKIFDDGKDEFLLYRIVILKEGEDYIKNVCREKRFAIRPYRFDPAEDRAEKDKKKELLTRKKALWSYLLRWCSTTYAEAFSAWIHLKAIRLYVESVLRYGLPVNFTAILIEPGRGKESKLRAELKNLYGKLAGNNVNLLASTDNEPDISGLTTGEFYPYVYLTVNLSD